MTHETNTSGKGDLTAFFDAARGAGEMPSGEFMARLEADALRLQPVPQARSRGTVWADLMRGLGGWPAVAGLTAAACVGLWIGASPPDVMLTLLQEQAVIHDVDPLSGYDYAMLGG